MLGLLSVISLVVGAFVAGGGAFDWEFLFSDGYREHGWVRNLGRAGARGLLMLLGGVLVVVGFVGQVVDNASKPVVVTTDTQETFDTPDQSPPTGRSGSPSGTTSQTRHPAPVKSPTAVSPNAVGVPQTSQSTAASPPPAAGVNQPITIWNPQLEFGEGETIIRLQYRFEKGHEPLSGAEYVWQIEVPDKWTEVPYDTLPSGGRLEYILRLPQPAKTFSEAWSTRLTVEQNGKRTPVSNRLDIARGQVRSTPLEVRP